MVPADPRRLPHHDFIREPCVALRGLDRSMTQDLLQRGEIAAPLQPLARERVPHLVNVEALHSRYVTSSRTRSWVERLALSIAMWTLHAVARPDDDRAAHPV